MSQQVLPILGAVVGSFWGQPQLGWAIGAAIGGVVAASETKPGPRLGDLPAQSFDEGTPRAIIYGTSQTSGYVIAAGPAIKTTEITDGGGKGGGGIEGEVAYRSYAIAMCEGPIAAVLRVWADDKLVYDVRPDSLILEQSEAWVSNKVFYLGTEDQLPDVFLQLNVSGMDTPAYRGTAYMVVGLEDLTDRRGTIPMYRFEVAGTASLSARVEPLVVHPWIAGMSPMNPDNDHIFQYSGFRTGGGGAESYPVAGVVRYSVEDAIEDMCNRWNNSPQVKTPPALTSPKLIAWFSNSERYPVDGAVADQQEEILLSYNEAKVLGYAPEPVPREEWPNITQTGGGLWGGGPRRNSVFYEDNPLPSDAEQWQRPDRRYSTSTSTGNAGLFEILYWCAVDGLVKVVRRPTPPSGFMRVSGAAKQLAEVEYRDGELYQNGIGPLLLPEDPDYNNTQFWEDARQAALAAGVIAEDVQSPVVVSEYAFGYGTGSGNPIPLSGIISDLCYRAGLAEDMTDVAELEDSVPGLTLAGDYTAASAIDVLRSCYFFDKCEPGDKLYFPKRGKPVVLTLDIDGLVEIPDLSRREQATEVPKKIHLHYANATAGYAPIKSTYMRSSADVQSTLETSIQVPVVLDTDQAAQMVEKMFKVTTADAQGEIKISVPDSFIRLVPSDCIGLNLRGQVRRLRIDDVEMADGVMHLTCRADRQSAYTSVLTGIPVDPPTLPPSTIPGETVYAVMDIPARVDSEDDLNYLVAGVGEAEGWAGWAYQRSLDAGANFATVASISAAAIMGRLVDPVSAASPWYTDRVNVVRVRLIRDGQVLEDLTEQQFLSEGGAFALHGPDGWEILQYLNAEDEGEGLFALSTLHRGLLNTEATAHVPDSLFVMLDRATHIPAQAAWLGQELTHRGVSLGSSPEGAAETTETFTGQSQREWPVASLRMTRSGDSITAPWAPRHRFGSDDQPTASVNFTGFRVTVTDGVSTHTADVTVPSYTYNVAGMGAEIEVRVAALNRITGAGPEVSTTGEYSGVDPVPDGSTASGIGAVYAASDAGYVALLDAVNYEVDGSGYIGPVNLYILEGDLGWFGGGDVTDSRVVLQANGEPTGLSCAAGVAYTSHIDRSAGASSVVSRVPFAGESSLAVTHTWGSTQPVTGIVAAHGKVWVADGYNGRIVVLDPNDLSELATIAQPAYALAANGTHVFAGLATQIVRIDPSTNAVVGPVYAHADDRGVPFGVSGERLFIGGVGVSAVDMPSGAVVSARTDVSAAPRTAYAGKVAQASKAGATPGSPFADRAKLLLDSGDLRTLASFLHPNASASPLNGVRVLSMLANGKALVSYSRDSFTNEPGYVELFTV